MWNSALNTMKSSREKYTVLVYHMQGFPTTEFYENFNISKLSILAVGCRRCSVLKNSEVAFYGKRFWPVMLVF